MSTFVPRGFGWQPDLPDARDFTIRHPQIQSLLNQLPPTTPDSFPNEVDLRLDGDGEYFTHVDDQGSLHASSAFATLAVIEYFERRIHGRTFDGSRLFLYRATTGRMAAGRRRFADSGARLRSTLKVLRQIGVPPEAYWPYEVERLIMRNSGDERLSGTRIKTNLRTTGEQFTEGYGLIDSWRIIRQRESGRMLELKVILSDWVFNAVLGSEVLTLHRNYFRLRKPLERRILGRPGTFFLASTSRSPQRYAPA